MAREPVLRAPRRLRRPEEGMAARFASAPVGNVVDAMGRTGAMDAAVGPVTRLCRFAGAALPVDAGPRDNLAPWAALRLARPGDVLVIATGGYLGASVCGDLLVGMARNAGIAAIVTDGAVRDRLGCDAAGIPVFAAGVCPNAPQKDGPGTVGLPVVCGGLAVAGGDVVIGDEDGVCVVPAARLEATLAALEAVRRKEAAMERAVAAGQAAPDWLADLPLDEIFAFTEDD